ncbi:MAG TPA: tetratricopeptide repeat protein, partial [Candidatus Kryptobacter bacterium]|nr:tetratricopeptide repeat protein [Candidatus Kryptobacter bacterium]
KEYKEASIILDDIKSDYDHTPAYPRSVLDRAQIFVEESDLAKAAETLKELLSKFPDADVVPEAHLELGNIYYAQEKFQDASDNFRAVYLDSLAGRSIVRDAMSQLISSYESLGMYDGALDITRKFIAMFPDDKSIMDKRIKVGILYEELRYFDQALITFQSLVKEANRDYQAELHYYVGAIYDDKGDYANAILEFLKVPYLVTPSAVVDWAAQAYYMAGKCYEQLNKPNEAIAMYQKIVDKPNTDPTFITGAEREINRVKALLK